MSMPRPDMSRLPVVDTDNRLTGMLTVPGLLRAYVAPLKALIVRYRVSPPLNRCFPETFALSYSIQRQIARGTTRGESTLCMT